MVPSYCGMSSPVVGVSSSHGGDPNLRRHGQEGLTGSTQLAEPFVVAVVDQDGFPLAGVTVSFSVTAGGGMLSSTTDANPCTVASSTSSTTAITDANGRAATRLTLGSDPGTNTVAATVVGLETVTFTSTAAEQAMPHSLTKVCGDSQEGMVDILLDEPFVVSVVDEDGTAMAGVVVSFAVTAGGGTLSAATATTDANGRAATRLTLGSDAGTNTVSATVEGLEPVTFTATGQKSPFASLFDLFGGGKLVALPDSPQLAQNAPNPFNSQTVLCLFLAGTRSSAPRSIRTDRATGGGLAPRAAAGGLPSAALGRLGRRRASLGQRHLSVSTGGGRSRVDAQTHSAEVAIFYGAPCPNSGEKGLDVLARGNGRWEWLVPIDLLKLDGRRGPS